MSIRSNFLLNTDYGTVKELSEFDKTFHIDQFSLTTQDWEAYTEKHIEFDAENINGLENCTIDLSGTGFNNVTTPNSSLVYTKSIQDGMLQAIFGIRKTTTGRCQIYASFYLLNLSGTFTIGPLDVRVRNHIFASPF